MKVEKELIFSNKGELLEGPLLIQPKVFKDERGLFLETWNNLKYKKLFNEENNFVQDNFSFSSKNVLRGLHYQIHPFAQGKLIRCSEGKVFDVAIDIRKDSPTFSQWAGVILDSISHNQFWIPSGFAHGFLVLTDFAGVTYKTNNYYSKESEFSIKWDDPTIGISWPQSKNKFIVSEKDSEALFLDEISPDKLF